MLTAVYQITNQIQIHHQVYAYPQNISFTWAWCCEQKWYISCGRISSNIEFSKAECELLNQVNTENIGYYSVLFSIPPNAWKLFSFAWFCLPYSPHFTFWLRRDSALLGHALKHFTFMYNRFLYFFVRYGLEQCETRKILVQLWL